MSAKCPPRSRLRLLTVCTLGLTSGGVCRKSYTASPRRAPQGDLSGNVIYIMQISDKLPMRDYDTFVRRHCWRKLPSMTHVDWRRRLGDAVYDFRHTPPLVRPSVHTVSNRRRDLGGHFALIATRFWYFGAGAIPLPRDLKELGQQRRGHRSNLNHRLIPRFQEWLKTLGPPGIRGQPQRCPPDRQRPGARSRQHEGCVC